ncbi:NADH-quinone oxidoreductase subunit NuoK [Planctomycetota bacterium]
MEIGLTHFLVISVVLFTFGTAMIVTRRNAVMVLMGLELLLNAAGINFVAFSRFTPAVSGHTNPLNHLSGDITALFVIVLAAAEAAVALAIVLNIYNTFNTIDVDEVDALRE